MRACRCMRNRPEHERPTYRHAPLVRMRVDSAWATPRHTVMATRGRKHPGVSRRHRALQPWVPPARPHARRAR
eukprot:8632364-Alexandrium_andersonii.AAC.1